MILTCPECATSYFVDDSRISPAGRTVKCSNCGARWTALREGAEPTQDEPPPQPAPAAESSTSVDELVVEGPDPPRPVPFVRPTLTPPRRAATGKMLAGAAAVVAALVAGAVFFRAEVVRVLPASQVVYAGLGMPVAGLVIENVHAEPTFQGGRPVLAVTGQIRNRRDTVAIVPSLRVSLLDRGGKPVAVKVARPIDANAPARAVRHFAIAIVDPPAGVHDLEVTFQTAAKAIAAPRAAEAVLGAPKPLDATPLPPGSPDALPPHD
jgi:predicted Zn finger-like uncharacterized protein